ncbi:MAG: 50S ribosomal protein L22 [Alphaproteobacteria bacterium]|nr:50S ribosomal protein L22 [Alphaproteobacteria bacterium]
MGQKANNRRVADNEAMAMAKYLKTSPQKLNLVADTIRGKDAGTALVDLEFNSRRVAQDVRKVLQSAVANAENNHGLDVDKLYVAEAYVGKSITMKRWRARARGRAAKIMKPFSRMTIVVRERDAEGKKAPAKKDAPKAQEAKKAPAKKAEAKTETAKKAPAKKAAAKKTAAKKTAAKKTTAKKTASKKTAAKKDTK